MQNSQDYLYYKGYIAGYRDGLKNANECQTLGAIEGDIMNLPIEAMALSARAHNCLYRNGCKYISDVVALSEYTITTARSMGPKTASEIACWLDEHGICYSAWSKFM